MYNPIATIRLQFNKAFTFRDLKAQLPFFVDLGVKTIYASPIFRAVPGSLHGYDVANPLTINPEIGTEEEFVSVRKKLAEKGIGWVQDIVPNHMAYHCCNPWILDVMEKGPMSVYANFFDITWSGDFFKARLMAPFLGSSLADAISSSAVSVTVDDGFFICVGDNFYPLNPRAYEYLLSQDNREVPTGILSLISQLQDLHAVGDNVQYNLRWSEIKTQFSALRNDEATSRYVSRCINKVNTDPNALQHICDTQFYRLCSYEETHGRINYRRFFTINDLICLNMQSDKVFDQYHTLIRKFVLDGTFNGLRVDHVDGLFDPQGYLRHLREMAGPDTYIIVEKILEPEEELSTQWPIQGTTGYEFLAAVNNLVTSRRAVRVFDELYKSISPESRSFHDRVLEKKRLILDKYMAGELENLCHYFTEFYPEGEISKSKLKSAIGELMVRCPYYRFYGNELPLPEPERTMFSDLLDDCAVHRPDLANEFDMLDEAILERPLTGDSSALKFYQRLMQYTGPLMAKGVEDTLMYTFNRLVAHNEVGDSPDQFGTSVQQFHELMTDRLKKWNFALNATATHDTKRGEDARMRLNVLTDVPGEWAQLVRYWMTINNVHKGTVGIDTNDEYFVYQTLIGTYTGDADDSYLPRLEEYLTKALREAKSHSSWEAPDEAYENAVIRFVRNILRKDRAFLESFAPFAAKVADHGMASSLTQLILKCTCPGVPDIYQASLLWDLSMVDPDNRRNIDYAHLLRTITSTKDPALLWEQRNNGAIKLWLTRKLLHIRNEHQQLFSVGHYYPLKVTGTLSRHVIAFAREHQGTWLIVAAMLHTAGIQNSRTVELTSLDWFDTAIHLPEDCPADAVDMLHGSKSMHNNRLYPREIFKQLPVSIMIMKHPERSRIAGVLLPVTSLPSQFSIGDLGPSAREFADFLFSARQKIWQMLPVNTVDDKAGFSPYSPLSAIAGNALLISPDDLVADGLLRTDAFGKNRSKQVVDYHEARAQKIELLREAWQTFRTRRPAVLTDEFESFKEKENDWLHGYAQFRVLHQLHDGTPWPRWPEQYRFRDERAIKKIELAHSEQIEQVKWIQFTFFRQMKSLREYCALRGIELYGDVPFYISHHAADVWLAPHLFALDDSLQLEAMAGVPPDYFNSDGQLWGMPVYRWDSAQRELFEWWVRRLRKNLEFFDLLRLDHFRAFVNYWAVPAGEKNAVNGKWINGPGIQFFEMLRKELGALPFVAEDLGDITPEVYELRDRFGMAGMKVLQFGFGNDFPTSPHLPHHHDEKFVVYPGTHDNNTTRGWFAKEIGNTEKGHLSMYIDRPLRQHSVARTFTRMAYASPARMAIIPMPDLLNLGDKARINKPSTVSNNWMWRLKGIPTNGLVDELRELVDTYER